MKKLTIRVSDELHAQLVALARVNQRSINREVVWIIERVVSGEITHKPTHKLPSPPSQQTDQDASPEAS